MDTPIFSIKRCPTNSRRYYVSFKLKKPFDMPLIVQSLKKAQFQELALTPSVVVFRSKDLRLTWHYQGLVQVDLNHELGENKKNIEYLIKEILVAK